MSEDYYTILGLSREASEDDIKKAYRKLVLKAHPDKGGDAEEFKKISEAYAVLSDSEKKETYDKYGKEGLNASNHGMPSAEDIFQNFFGGMGMNMGMNMHMNHNFRREQKKRDKVEELELTLEEIYSGKRKQITIERITIDQTKKQKCQNCDGKGMKVTIHSLGIGMIQQQLHECDKCSGLGFKVPEEFMTVKKETLTFEIPPGCSHDQQIRLQGKANDFPGQETGDLIFVIKYKAHKLYEVQTDDIVCNLKINLYESLVGFTRYIKHLDGSFLKVQSDSIIKPDTIKCIRNEGIRKNGSLVIKFDIDYPRSLIIDDDMKLSNFLSQKSLVQKVDKNDRVRDVSIHDYSERQQHQQHHHQQRVHECHQQ